MNNEFLFTLGIMGKGMLGIFIVTLAIMLSMYVLNKIPSKEDTK